MNKEEQYKQFHKELAKKFGSSEEVIAIIRKLNRGGDGLSASEIKNYLREKIDGRNIEISRMLANIKRDSEVIKYLDTVSLSTVEEMLKIQSGI